MGKKKSVRWSEVRTEVKCAVKWSEVKGRQGKGPITYFCFNFCNLFVIGHCTHRDKGLLYRISDPTFESFYLIRTGGFFDESVLDYLDWNGFFGFFWVFRECGHSKVDVQYLIYWQSQHVYDCPCFIFILSSTTLLEANVLWWAHHEHSDEPAPTSTPWRMDDGKWWGNSFLLGFSSLANHGD
jgi:hypothetical protein